MNETKRTIRRLRRELTRARCELARERSEARTCPLTGVGNRRAWHEELDRRRELGEAFSVVLFDVANLKAANEALGHVGADELLVDVARSLRAGDRVVRYGGDEFAVFLPGADRAAAELVRDRLEARFRPRELDGGVSVFLVGAPATWAPERGTLDAELVEADFRLEERKRARKLERGEPTTRAEALARIQPRP